MIISSLMEHKFLYIKAFPVPLYLYKKNIPSTPPLTGDMILSKSSSAHRPITKQPNVFNPTYYLGCNTSLPRLAYFQLQQDKFVL